MPFIKKLILATLIGTLGPVPEDAVFKGSFYNKAFDVFLVIDLYEASITPPEHEIYGPLQGYLAKPTSSFYWLITDAEIDGDKAALQMINDFGSEDLTATLTQLNDSTFRLTQGKGSSIKVPNKGKWMKLPKTLDFIKR